MIGIGLCKSEIDSARNRQPVQFSQKRKSACKTGRLVSKSGQQIVDKL